MTNPFPDPSGFQYSPMNWFTPPPETPLMREKRLLRRDGNTVGILMLGMSAASMLAFPLVLFLLFVAGFITKEQLTQPNFGMNQTVYLLVYGVVYTLAMGVPAILIAQARRCRFNPFGQTEAVKPSDAFFGLFGSLGVCMAGNLVSSIVVSFFMQFGVERPQTPPALEPTSDTLLLNILVVAVLPALLEEMLFRGYVLRLLRPYGDGLAVVVSALLFGLMHGNIAQVPFAIVVGMSFGWLYVSTNNIWLPIVAHFLNNALSICTSYLSEYLDGIWGNLYITAVLYLVIFVGGTALLVLLLRHSPLLRKPAKVSLLTVSQRLSTLVRTPALVVAVIVFILLLVRSMLS